MRIFSIEIRLLGSNYSILPIRSRQSSLAFGISSLLLLFLIGLNSPIICYSLFFDEKFKFYISLSVRVPVHINILYSILMPQVPGKRGLPLYISANMHPKLQTSTALEYYVNPSKIYGARRYAIVCICRY